MTASSVLEKMSISACKVLQDSLCTTAVLSACATKHGNPRPVSTPFFYDEVQRIVPVVTGE